jgi:hypothetical protein
MTIAERLREIANSKEFRPFRVVLETGEELHIERRFRTTVAEPLAVFAVQEDPETRSARKLRIVSLRNIKRIEIVPDPRDN